MRFHFDGNQAYQLRAIEAVADLFRGQPRLTLDYGSFAFGEFFSPVANRLDLDESQLLGNLRAVQERNHLPADPKLELLEEPIDTATGPQLARFPNFSVEMETGTGKTMCTSARPWSCTPATACASSSSSCCRSPSARAS
jgi:type III restriction enzyme